MHKTNEVGTSTYEIISEAGHAQVTPLHLTVALAVRSEPLRSGVANASGSDIIAPILLNARPPYQRTRTCAFAGGRQLEGIGVRENIRMQSTFVITHKLKNQIKFRLHH
jgi:hypothetical protein